MVGLLHCQRRCERTPPWKLSPHNAVLDERLHRGRSRDEDGFSEASHVDVNVADDTGPADPEGRAVGSLVNLGLPKLAGSFNQQALSHVHSFSAGTQLCLSSSLVHSQTRRPHCRQS